MIVEPFPVLPAAGLDVLTSHRNRKLVAPLIVVAADRITSAHYLRELLPLDGSTVVLWPWPGQWSTQVFQTTVADIEQFERSR